MFHTRISPPRQHVPPGLQTGRFFSIVDCGTQESSFAGKTISAPVLNISAEFPAHTYKDGELKGRPLVITRRFTNSMSERANLRKFIDGYRGMAFPNDVEVLKFMNEKFHQLIGRAAKFNITHTTKGNGDLFSTFESAMQEKGLVCPAAINKPVLFTMAEVSLWNPSAADVASMSPTIKAVHQAYGPMKDVFTLLHDKLQERISNSPEFKAISHGRKIDPTSQPDAPSHEDDDVPF